MPLDLALHDPAEVGMSAARLQRAAELMQRQHDEGRSPILAAAVARHGTLVFAHAVGQRTPGGPPLRVDDVFPVASNGKPVTAATVLALVERGRIGLNEPVTVHLPELLEADPANGEVMVHHLLTHTSGWDEEAVDTRMLERLAEGVGDPPPDRDLLEHILLSWDVPRGRPPGERMQYLNYNYTLLGEIIRRATGTTLDEAARRYVLDPVGMTSSAYIVTDELRKRLIERPHGIPFAPGHDDSPIAFHNRQWQDCDDGGCGLHTTTFDTLRFHQMLLDGGRVGDTQVLCADAVRMMTTNQIPGIPGQLLELVFPEGSWGFGHGVVGSQAFPRFRGGTIRRGSNRHGGAGGAMSWMDPGLGLNVAYFEVWSAMRDRAPTSSAAHRFDDVVMAAVVD